MKVDNSIKITGLIVVGVIIVALIFSNMFSGAIPGETISVEGVSSISVTPDLVSVYFNVENLNDTAAGAKDSNAEIVSDVKAALIDAGFDREDFETQNFNVYEDFDWTSSKRISLGYKATHTIVVSIDAEDESLIGKAIDAGVDNGALLSYINFALSQELENEYKAKAMKLAAEDARVKAEAVAEGLGARLGRVVSTGSSDFGFYPRVAFSEDSLGSGDLKGSEIATNIQISDQEVTSRISVTYKIK